MNYDNISIATTRIRYARFANHAAGVPNDSSCTVPDQEKAKEQSHFLKVVATRLITGRSLSAPSKSSENFPILLGHHARSRPGPHF